MTQSDKTISQMDLDQADLFDQIEKYAYRKQCYVDEIGSGAFARVYRCTSKQDQQNYALKIYSYALLKSKFDEMSLKKMMDFVNQEARLMQECHSPHIVKCYQTMQSHHYKILVLEYCSNQNLWQYLFRNGGSLPEHQAIKIIKQISLGLIELHGRKIIHRDLKLQNIMIKNGICKIIDLGLSRQLERESCIMSTNVGTDYTKAPEIKSSKSYGLKADIFSLGVIFLILISDKECPFEKRSVHNFLNNINVIFKNVGRITFESLDFLNKTLEPNQYNRMSWRELLKHKIFQNVSILSQSQIVHFQQYIKAQINQPQPDIVLDCSEILQANSSRHQSSIFVEEEDVVNDQHKSFIIVDQQAEIGHRQIVEQQKPCNEAEYPLQVRSYYLQCKKAQFILRQLIENLQNNCQKLVEKEFESRSILLYLLSLSALNFTLEAQDYFTANFYRQFEKQVTILIQQIRKKYEVYKQILMNHLKRIKNAFIQSQIFKNYRPLKEFLQQYPSKEAISTLQIFNLIEHYIGRLTPIILNKKVKSRLLSFRQVMMVTQQDLMISDFETKATQIRIKYIK